MNRFINGVGLPLLGMAAMMHSFSHWVKDMEDFMDSAKKRSGTEKYQRRMAFIRSVRAGRKHSKRRRA